MPGNRNRNRNRIRTVPPLPRPAGLPVMETVAGGEIAAGHAAHLADESRLAGRAELLAFPLCETDVCELLRRGGTVTVSAGRTGIVGGAVPQGGTLLSTERMDWLLVEERGFDRGSDPARFAARCGPGLALDRLAAELARRAPPLFLPPNPTEGSARIGGAVAANASGSRSYRWGAIRRWVRGLRVVLACGEVLALERGQCLAGPDGFVVELAGGGELCVPLPGCAMPAVKSAAGYWSEPGMDLVDLFVGSEGTLGVITEATLMLEPLPESLASLLAFFPDEPHALGFVRQAGNENGAGVQAIEYFDGASLELLAAKRAGDGPGSTVPVTPAGAGAAVLVEVVGSGAETESACECLAGLVEACGGDPELAWAGLDARARERLAAFRHALPEAVNSLIGRAQREHPGLTKVGTDMAVPPSRLEEMLAAYRRVLDAAGLHYVVFGHIGDGHLHVNVLPRDISEHRRARELYLALARLAVDLGGTVSAEHGIGKLKRQFLELMYGPGGIAAMRRTKRALDPQWRLGPGTLFEDGSDR